MVDLDRPTKAAIGTFIFGDLVTTLIALSYMTGFRETNPVANIVIEGMGLYYLIPLKLAVFLGFYIAYKKVPKPHNMGIMYGLVIVGTTITVYNSILLLSTITKIA